MHGWDFTFTTKSFVDGKEALDERVNEAVGGHALAQWLSAELNEAGVEASAPWHEDHGCDFGLTHDGRRYLCVASIEEDGKPVREAHIQLVHHRSLLDRLMGRNAFDPDAGLGRLVHGLLARNPDVNALIEEESQE